jgi:hypothetical protein
MADHNRSNTYGKEAPHRIALNPLPVEAAFSAGAPVDASRRRVTVEPAAAAVVLAVADVRVAVGVLAGAACALGDCAFPVVALSVVADATSVADEVAADERWAAPAVYCLAVLDGLQVVRDDPHLVVRDVRCRAFRDDPHLVARGAPCRAVLDDPRLVARDVRYRAALDDLLQDDLHRVALVAGLAGRGDCCQDDQGAR